ncbi:hypothetical protein EJB05_04935, partial [Eragrostis curvula]
MEVPHGQNTSSGSRTRSRPTATSSTRTGGGAGLRGRLVLGPAELRQVDPTPPRGQVRQGVRRRRVRTPQDAKVSTADEPRLQLRNCRSCRSGRPGSRASRAGRWCSRRSPRRRGSSCASTSLLTRTRDTPTRGTRGRTGRLGRLRSRRTSQATRRRGTRTWRRQRAASAAAAAKAAMELSRGKPRGASDKMGHARNYSSEMEDFPEDEANRGNFADSELKHHEQQEPVRGRPASVRTKRGF